MTDAIEVRLLRWGESSQAGRTVTFLLPEDGEHPFRGMKTGKTGDLFAMALAKIADTEAKADNVFGETGYTAGSEPTEGQKAVKRAVMLCKDPEFQEWCRLQCNVPSAVVATEELGRFTILTQCGIASRRDLAVNPEAVEKFRALETSFRYRDQVR